MSARVFIFNTLTCSGEKFRLLPFSSQVLFCWLRCTQHMKRILHSARDHPTRMVLPGYQTTKIVRITNQICMYTIDKLESKIFWSPSTSTQAKGGWSWSRIIWLSYSQLGPQSCTSVYWNSGPWSWLDNGPKRNALLSCLDVYLEPSTLFDPTYLPVQWQSKSLNSSSVPASIIKAQCANNTTNTWIFVNGLRSNPIHCTQNDAWKLRCCTNEP